MLILIGLQMGARMNVLSEDVWDQSDSSKLTARRGSTESARAALTPDKSEHHSSHPPVASL